MNGGCRCCGRTDDFEPVAGLASWRSPTCDPCTANPHTHTWLPPKTWEQLEQEAREKRRRNLFPSISEMSF